MAEAEGGFQSQPEDGTSNRQLARRGSALQALEFTTTAPALLPRTEDSSIGTVEAQDHGIASDLLEGPPDSAEPLATIFDRNDNFRGYIEKSDGACYNNIGRCIGYINAESLEAGSADGESFLGALNDGMDGAEASATDALDEVLATVSLGQAKIKDADGRTLCELGRDGSITSNLSENLGQMRGLGFQDLRLMTLCTFIHLQSILCFNLYLLLVFLKICRLNDY